MPRPVAHLANLDLNPLVALRQLVRERSVTRAGRPPPLIFQRVSELAVHAGPAAW